jgi:hypothetical protein
MPAGGIEQNVKFAYPAWVEGSNRYGQDEEIHGPKPGASIDLRL